MGTYRTLPQQDKLGDLDVNFDSKALVLKHIVNLPREKKKKYKCKYKIKKKIQWYPNWDSWNREEMLGKSYGNLKKVWTLVNNISILIN